MSRRRAFLLGVEKYSSFTPTRFCHADVALLKDVLTQDCDYAVTDIEVCNAMPGDAGCTPLSIIEKLKSMASRTRSGDTMLFYFAGHGAQEGDDSYIVLPDSRSGEFRKTALPLREISDIFRLDDVACFRFFDACQSGQDVRGGTTNLHSDQFIRSAMESSIADGWATFAACRQQEYSYAHESFGNGVFTHYLAEAIRGIPKGERVLLEEVKVRVCDKVEEWARDNGRSQTPTLTSALHGNVPFAYRATTPDPENSAAPSVRPVTPAPLDARLAALRQVSLPTVEQIGVRVGELAELLRQSLDRAASGHNWHDAEPAEVIVKSVWSAEESVKGEIYKAGTKAGLRPLQYLHEEKEYEGSTLGHKLLGITGRVKKVAYTISEGDFPNSYVTLSVGASRFTASLFVFGYILPLQATCCIILGGWVTAPILRDTAVKRLRTRSYIIKAADGGGVVAGVTEDCIREAHKLFEAQTEAHVKYLEWELSQAGTPLVLDAEDGGS